MFAIKHGQSQQLEFKKYSVGDVRIEAAILLDDFIIYGIDRTYTGRKGDYVLRTKSGHVVCFREVFEQLFERSFL